MEDFVTFENSAASGDKIDLVMGEKVHYDETGQKEKYVEEFVENMPPKGHLSKEIEQLFYIK